MNQRRIHTAAPIDFAAVRAELGIVVDFPPEVQADAVAAVQRGPWIAPDRPDRTDIALVTLDPVGSMDLDQAVHLERIGTGYRVHYAIADVAAWVEPESAVATESFRRGTTLYSPDLSAPLHPRELSEGAGSLLPGERRPAVLWSIDLDERGDAVSTDLTRCWVRSQARLDYAGVAADRTNETVHPSIGLLAEIGALRRQLSAKRHAITLDLPDVEVVHVDESNAQGWDLRLRPMMTVEQDNAEISLLTGMVAASIMLAGGTGILRTLPSPSDKQLKELRRATTALPVDWPPGTPPGDIIARLDGSDPVQAAFLEQAAKLLRGADYTPFGPGLAHAEPELTDHGGVGAPYAHVTAPLRRLVDRFGTEVCLALHHGNPVPDWVLSRLDDLPHVMSTADQRANALEKACIGAVGAFLLAGREGEQFDATVSTIDRERELATVVLADPPVRAKCAAGELVVGDRVGVVLRAVDRATHSYRVEVAPESPAAG